MPKPTQQPPDQPTPEHQRGGADMPQRHPVTRVLTAVADRLDADHPNHKMTNAARIGLVCQFIPGEPDLFDEVFPALPAITPQRTRSEYAAELRRIAGAR